MNRTNLSLLVVVGLLLTLGIVMIYSTSSVYCEEKFGDPNFFLYRQFIWLFIGTIALLVT